MAIVENRSTEIGDVIRIQSNVPIIGVFSLSAFIDDTLGEVSGSASGIIPPFEDGTRQNNAAVLTVQNGDIRYAVTRSVDGSARQVGIAALDTSVGIWDTAYPENTNVMRRIIYGNNRLYAIHNLPEGEGINTYRVGISVLDLTARTWTLLNDFTGSYLIVNFAGDKVVDGKLYFMARGASGEAPILVAYDIAGNSYAQESTFPVIAQITGLTCDSTNRQLYTTYAMGRAGLQSTMYIYDVDTSTWSLSTSIVPSIFYSQIYFNLDDQLIYAFSRVNVAGETYKLITYDPVTDAWDDTGPEPLQTHTSYVTGGNDRIYVRNNNDEVLTYIPATRTWVSGEGTGDRQFLKQFRFSVNGGLTFSPFMDLTDINVQSIEVNEKDSFIVDISYQRFGTDATGELAFNSVTLLGQFQGQRYPIYDSTIFKGLFEVVDVNVLGWAINVLEKLYQRGLLPDYVDRNREGIDDADFITFWYSVTHLFAILVYWMRSFENIPANKLLLIQFLENFDITLPFDENLTDLGAIYTQRVDEYRRRGTQRMTTPGTDPDEDVDGELLRLIGWEDGDFFLFALTEASEFGWCIGVSSPTWTGTYGITNLIIGFEFTESVEDLTAYPTLGGANVDIFEDPAIGINVMRVAGYAGVTGLYGFRPNPTTSELDRLFPIDPALNYEISFRVKKIGSDPIDLRFEAFAYDASRTRVNMIPINGSAADVNSFQFPVAAQTVLVQDIYYRYNAIVYGSGEPNNTDFVGNITGYRGLRLPANARFLSFGVYVDGTAARSDFYLYDIKMRPKDLPISQGLFGVKNIIIGYMNNGGQLSDEQARLFIQNKLIPYNSFLIPNWL